MLNSRKDVFTINLGDYSKLGGQHMQFDKLEKYIIWIEELLPQEHLDLCTTCMVNCLLR